MPKLELGTRKFDVMPFDPNDPHNFLLYPQLESVVKGIEKKLKLSWACDKTPGTPEPFPTKFPDAGSSFDVYAEPDKGKPTKERIQKASLIVTSQFVRFTGFANLGAMFNELGQMLGKYDPTFDVDKAIEKFKKTKRLKITVSLKYKHFVLRHAKIDPRVYIVVSVPDSVEILSKDTHDCTANGVVKRANPSSDPDLRVGTMVRAKTDTAHKLRKFARKKEADEIAAELKRLKAKKKTLDEELEGIKPLETPEED